MQSFPHALGPEKSLLSSMLQDPLDYIGIAVEENLSPAHFYMPAHAELFEFLLYCYENGIEIELVGLVQELHDRGKLDRVGGPSTLTDIYTYAPSPGHFRAHLAHVKNKFTARQLINLGAETTQDVYESPDEIERVLDTAEAKMTAIREARETVQIETIAKSIEWVLDDIRARVEGKTEEFGLRSGFPDLDRFTGGLQGGDMYVIAARPSMGKTSFVMNILEYLALEEREPAAFFSLEMPQRRIVQRLVYSRAKFNGQKLMEGKRPDKGDLLRIQRASLDIKASPLHIDDTAALTLNQLRAKLRRLKRDKGIRVAGVDYLQIMKSYSRQATNSREREISEISGGVKAIAKELDIPILILAQLNRESEKRGGKDKGGRPRMSDLRESGAIEQDADFVGLLYREAYGLEGEAKDEAGGQSELIVAKNRNGETGSVHLTFIPELARFESGAKPSQAAAEPMMHFTDTDFGGRRQ